MIRFSMEGEGKVMKKILLFVYKSKTKRKTCNNELKMNNGKKQHGSITSSQFLKNLVVKL